MVTNSHNGSYGHLRNENDIVSFCLSPEFSQMKGEYGTIMNDADSANCINHLRVLHDAIRETFLKVTNNEI